MIFLRIFNFFISGTLKSTFYFIYLNVRYLLKFSYNSVTLLNTDYYLKKKYFNYYLYCDFYKFLFNNLIFTGNYIYSILILKFFKLKFRIKNIEVYNYFIIIFNNLFYYTSLFIFSLINFLFIIYLFIVLHNIPFGKLVASLLMTIFFLYLLISGFIYFIKKINYSKYTDFYQRFWKRSFTIFWLIEGYIFLAFVYLTLNASNEIFFIFDAALLNKLHIFSLRFFIIKITFIILMIIFCQLLIELSLSTNNGFVQLINKTISVFIVLIALIELYQFYLYLNFADFFWWIFSSETINASLDFEIRKIRNINNFILLCSLAKFWHFVFIALFWFFYINNKFIINENQNLFLSISLQNLIILLILNFIIEYPYIKILLRPLLSNSYSAFYVDFMIQFSDAFINLFYIIYTDIFQIVINVF